MASKSVDVYALTSAEVIALAAFVARARAAGVKPLGVVSSRIVEAVLAEGERLAVFASEVQS